MGREWQGIPQSHTAGVFSSFFPTPQNPSRRHQVEELIRRGSALLKEELI
jgi:hypothetical protein